MIGVLSEKGYTTLDIKGGCVKPLAVTRNKLDRDSATDSSFEPKRTNSTLCTVYVRLTLNALLL